MKLLLMSSSRSADSGFLEENADDIRDLLAGVERALFIPYAIVGQKPERIAMVVDRFRDLGIALDDIEMSADPLNAVNAAEAVLVSGGNTFQLLKSLYENNLVSVLRDRVQNDMPYVGWSAGSNVAGRSIRTTNDMPIVYPPSFRALEFLPFQLNPHYTDTMPPGVKGETREQRIEEFLDLHPDERVVGLPEGDALYRRGDTLQLRGAHDAWLFEAGKSRLKLSAERDLSHLL